MLRRTARLALLFSLSLLLSSPLSALADTHTVCTLMFPGCQYTNIQAAINAASDGDTVLVRNGTYHQRFSLPITRSITLVSQNGPASTIIDGTGQPTELVAFLSGSVPSTFDGFTVANGSFGGITIVNSSPVIRNCVIQGNTHDNGGGIWMTGSSPTITGCTIANNTATSKGGGVMAAGGSPTFSGCTFSANTADQDGGGANGSGGTLVIRNCAFTGNTTNGAGGGLFHTGGSLVLENSDFTGNTGKIMGGGACLPECTSVTISGCSFAANSVLVAGGGLAVFTCLGLDLRDTNLRGNSASIMYGGGGLFVADTAGTIHNCTATDNSGGSMGGGILLMAGESLAVIPVLSECVISGNNAPKGGGIAIAGLSPDLVSARLTNCLISGNKADSGGGLLVDGATLTLVNSTIADNYGGGVSVSTATLHAANDILWGNATLGLVGEIQVAEEPSTIVVAYSDVQGGWPGTGNIGRRPRFLLPRANGFAPTSEGDYRVRGGRTLDRGSSAGAPALDLLGNARPQGRGADMGAFEAGVLKNGFMEGGGILPLPWTGVNLSALDRRVSTEAVDGKSSFRLTGGPVSKALGQTVKMNGAGGSTLGLTGWSKGEEVPAGGAYGVYLTVKYVVGGSKTYKLEFTRGSHDWEKQAASIVAEEDFTSVTVRLRYGGRTGTAWFDGVELFVE